MTLDVQALSDRTEILELRARYGRALDDKDWDLMREVFTEDGYGDFGKGEPFEGIEQILHVSRSVMENLHHTQHFFGNHEVDLDGDRASGRCSLIGSARKSTDQGGSDVCLRGYYTDQYTRTEEGWRISRRVLTVTWGEGNVGIFSEGAEALRGA